ncbi:MAG TPA: BTAD domain-containing putative transcriptional regulator [Candidatus Baltobacteraceae bacterium]|nr:BTAD domain-containing putative transcriptional regulator [Candidatus Baltobacteraceae bacterium]
MGSSSDFPAELLREALLERVERVRPKILALLAPAGFGKSTFVRQLISGRPAAVCDLAGVAGRLELARRIVPALAAEVPERAADLTPCELSLSDAGSPEAERLDRAVQAWKDPTPGTVFAFENAEAIAHNAPAREFFGRLLAELPPGRQIVISSREPLRVHLSRFASPHEILTLRAEDLAFDRYEVARLFESSGSQPPLLARVMQISQGWPIAVFLLKRFLREGRIEELLERLDDVAFDELQDYLSDQVLAGLEPALLDALFACACIPHATLADLQAALSSEEPVGLLVEFAKDSPFLRRRSDGAFAVHPLLASQLLEHRNDTRDRLLARTAAAHAAAERFERAAELQLARGDAAAAARMLAQHEVVLDHAPSMTYARILASLERGVIQRYPRLWAVTALLRMFCVDTEDLLDEAESMWRMLARDVSPMERSYILVFRVLFMSYMGLAQEAGELLAQFGAEIGIGEEPTNSLEGYIFYLMGVLLARTGRVAQAERRLMPAIPFVSEMDVAACSIMTTLGADIARVRGEYAMARQFIERAIEHARRSGLQNILALVLAEAAFGAWLRGDEADLNRYAVELDDVVQRNGVRGLSYFAGALRGRNVEPQDCDLLKWVACGRIIQASSSADSVSAARHARGAVAAARQYAAPFVETLALIALAAFDHVAFDDHLRAAQALAERCESPALVEAVNNVAAGSGDRGILEALMSRLQRRRTQREPVLEVQLVTGAVRAGGRAVVLSEREHALLLALAVRRETVPRSRLSSILWPDLDEYAARNALSVCLHRLRGRLGGGDAIVRSADGYALSDDVRVDLWEYDRAMASMRSRAAVTEADNRVLDAMYEQLRLSRPDRLTQWEWFEPTDRHIRELRLEVAQRLAGYALGHGNAHRALELAHDMIAADACDEAARQLAITAHLAMGDRSAAMRQYRQYRETLMAELQCEPSDELKRLVGITGVA